MREILKRWFPLSAVKDISLLTVGQFFVYFLGFLYSILAARILGPGSYGKLLAIIAMVKLIGIPFHFQLGSPLVKLIRKKLEANSFSEGESILQSAVLAQIGGMFVFGTLFLLFLIFLPPYWELFRDWQVALGLFALSEIFLNCRIVLPFLQALEKFSWMVGYEITVAILRNLLPVLFMFRGVQAACFGYLIAELILVAGTLVLYLYFFGPQLFCLWKHTVGELVGYLQELYQHSRSNYVANMMKKGLGKATPLVIGSFVGTAQIAYFKIGLKTAPIFRFISKPLRRYLAPRFVGKWETDKSEFYYTLRKYFYQVIPVYAVLGVSLAFLLPWLIPLFFGASYSPAVKVAWIILPGVVLSYTFYIFRSIVFAVDYPRALFNGTLVLFLVGLPLTLVLSYYFSYRGAAWAWTMSRFAVVGYQIYFLFSVFGTRWFMPTAEDNLSS